MICEKCHRENAENAAFCNGCGAKLNPALYCPKCGAMLPPACVFCSKCGSEVHAEPFAVRPKPKRKKVPFSTLVSSAVAVLLAFALLLALIIPGSGMGIASKKFSTPEDAMQYFAKCVGSGDVNGALAAFDFEEKAEKTDFAAAIDYVRAFYPTQMTFPAKYKEYGQMNKIYIASQDSSYIKMFMYSFLLDEKYTGGTVVNMNGNSDTSSDILNHIDPSRINGLKLVRADLASPGKQSTSANLSNVQKRAKVYGFTDFRDYVALYEWNGQTYLGGFLLVKYDNYWKINALTSNFGGTPSYGTVSPVTEKEYLSLTQ